MACEATRKYVLHALTQISTAEEVWDRVHFWTRESITEALNELVAQRLVCRVGAAHYERAPGD